MNYGQLKSAVLKLVDEYSSRGAIQAKTKTADMQFKIQDLANDTMYDLASTTAKIPAVFNITNNPVCNRLDQDTSHIQKHLPGVDFSIQVTGAKATFFEASGPATIKIEELSNGAWNVLETIDVPSAQTTLTEYRRIITPTSDYNPVRLRFTGDTVYDYRNYILYPYMWPDEANIQQHRPFMEYDLPDDYLAINYVLAKKDTRQYSPYSNHILTPNKRIAINRYDIGEYQVYYWRKPQLLVFTGDDAVDDQQTLDISEDGARTAPYNIAGQILISEGETAKGTLLVNQYENKKQMLVGNDESYSAHVIDMMGWS